MSVIKLQIVVDTKIAYLNEIEEGLRLQNEEYKIATDGAIEIQHTIVRKDLSQLPWIDYWAGNYGVDYGWIAQNTKGIKDFGVAFVIDDSNWSPLASGIWGWNCGFYNGVNVQLIRTAKGRTVRLASTGETFIGCFITFYEELMHAWDDAIYATLKVDLNEYFHADWDETIVHGYQIGDNWERWKYREALKAIKPFLLKLFSPNIMLKAIRKKGTTETYILINSKPVYVTGKKFEDLVAEGLVRWEDVKEADFDIYADGVLG